MEYGESCTAGYPLALKASHAGVEASLVSCRKDWRASHIGAESAWRADRAAKLEPERARNKCSHDDDGDGGVDKDTENDEDYDDNDDDDN